MRGILSIFFFLFFIQEAFCLVSVGHMSPFLGRWQEDTSGTTSSAFDLHPYIAFNTKTPIFGSHLFFPELGYVFPKSSHDQDSPTKRSTLYLLYNLGYPIMEGTYLKYGLGTFITKISGQGGTVTRRNGSSSREFDVPSETVSSYNTTLNLGIEIFPSESYSAKIEGHLWNFFNSDNRSVNFNIGFSYYL